MNVTRDIRKIAIALPLAVFAACGAAADAFEDVPESQIISVNGDVTESDQFDSTLTLRWLDDVVTQQYKEITFAVTPETDLTVNGQKAELEDIYGGEPAAATYCLDSKGRPRLLSVNITN